MIFPLRKVAPFEFSLPADAGNSLAYIVDAMVVCVCGCAKLCKLLHRET
jgi:hypothetical protein